MDGRLTAFAVAVAIALLSSTRLLASSGPPWTPEDVRKSVQRSDLVIRGVIDSVGTGTAPEHEIKTTREFPTTVIHVHVSNVIKGRWAGTRIDAVLLGTAQAGTAGVSYDYKPGQDVVLCLRFDPEAHGGMYRFWVDEQSFVNREGKWRTRGQWGGNGISLESVLEAARQTDPGAMAREADAVLVGTVRSVERRTLNPDGSSTPGDDGSHTKPTADYTRVLVTDGLKSLSSGDSLLVRVLRRGSELDWWEPVPTLQPGKSYLMFLKRDSVGYYPFRGFNGFLEIRGNQLILDDHLPYSLTPAQVNAAVRQALNPR
jgi:hypothetical protein